MLTRITRVLGVVLSVWAFGASAQTPMSAIDWLSDSIAAPKNVPTDQPETGVSTTALPEEVTVSALGGPLPDAVGLLPASVSGLPVDLWNGSSSADIARRLRAERDDILPAMQDLLYTLLLAELDPPADSGPASTLFLARVDTLLGLGALEQAQSLLSHVGTSNPEVFRRAFDTSLLLRSENKSCDVLRSTPSLSPTFPARIFCLARGGDWDAAALTLETARALGFVTEAEDELLARFLEPALSDDAPLMVMPDRPSPLEFRLLEAIGEPIPTAKLPRAYAHADLHTNSGWKTQLYAAERLVSTGALDPNQLLGLYTERRPAASGGVWDRVQAVQSFDAAIKSGDVNQVASTLPLAWRLMESAELEVPFARLFAVPLAEYELVGESKKTAFKIGLLSDDYKSYSDASALDGDYPIYSGIAGGSLDGINSKEPLINAIIDGFRSFGIPVRLQTMIGQGRMGEAILRAMELFANGSKGDLDELTDALVFFRSIGLEDTARRASLQLLLLDRRG